MSTESKTRPYRKRRRAEQEEQTRLRITEAAVDLHGSVGPARTTVSAVAERAGVQRATVYRHFPDEEALFAACSSHWAMLNPPPDPTAWGEDRPSRSERLRRALAELYAWYGRNEQMLENITPRRPAGAGDARCRRANSGGLLRRGRRGPAGAAGASAERAGAASRAAIGHALAFDTWRSLVREQGLSADEAVELIADLVDCASRA